MDVTFAAIPDRLWRRVAPLLPREPPKPQGGRPRVPDRTILAGILYRLRTGCQWKALPPQFGSGSTCHRRFQQWGEAGVFERVFADLLRYYDAQRRIQWRWASLDTALVKAPKGGRRRGRTPRTAPNAGSSATS